MAHEQRRLERHHRNRFWAGKLAELLLLGIITIMVIVVVKILGPGPESIRFKTINGLIISEQMSMG